MTLSLLLFSILVTIAAQIAIGVALAVFRARAKQPGLDLEGSDEPPTAETAAWPGWRSFRIDRRVFEDPSQSQCSFHLKPVDGVPLPPFQPGQFLTVRLPIGEGLVRCYSLSDGPKAEAYRLTIKRVPAPAGRPELPPGLASTYVHDNLNVGDIIDIKAPAGQFVLASDPRLPIVFIAGGVGVTPMMSLLSVCLADQPNRPVHLYYGIRNGRQHAFRESLEQLAASHPNFQLTVVYSHPDIQDVRRPGDQQPGYIDLDLLKHTLPIGRHQFYVCGPPPMMATLLPGLRAWGVAEKDIHFEAFGPTSARSALGDAGEVATLPAAPIAVTFRRSGRTLSWDGQDRNLLDFAERNGIAIEAGCRTGGCGSCETKVLTGAVRYARIPDHEIADGWCLMCVGAPVSDLALEA